MGIDPDRAQPPGRSIVRMDSTQTSLFKRPLPSGDGPTKLFVYYQPLSAGSAAARALATAANQPAAPTAAGGPEPWVNAGGKQGAGAESAAAGPELFLTEVRMCMGFCWGGI
jgi:hypothetical protein